MNMCTRCVLPESFPGISFDDEGVCNFCRSFKPEKLQESKEKYRDRFERLLAERRRGGGYDAITAYSGGKDSTYTLMMLRRRFGLSILALTLDNGFISPASIENIRGVVEALGVDHVLYKPRFDLLRKIFRTAVTSQMYAAKTLERASTICTSCMGIVKFVTLRMAIEGDIPFVAYGWSPGQAPIEASIFKNNPAMIRSMQKALLEPMRDAAGTDIDNYFLTEAHFAAAERFPYNVSPLAFLDYDEERIIEEIAALGWKKPDDTDPNSTNCLLNAFANTIHKKAWNFHPYAFELAKLVREGYMDRGEALSRLDTPEIPEIVSRVRRRLEIESDR
jgi:thymidine kinase